MTNMIINPSDEKALENATAQPHGFVYLDKILQMKSDGYNVQVTLGWQTPQGTYSPVVTAAMPIPFAKELAAALTAKISDVAPLRLGGGDDN